MKKVIRVYQEVNEGLDLGLHLEEPKKKAIMKSMLVKDGEAQQII